MKTGNRHTSNGVERDLLSPSAKAALLNKEAEGDKQRPRDEDILKVLPEAVYVTDADGRITFFNEAAVSLWGARPELGKSEFCRTWKLYRPDGTPVPPEESLAAFALKQKLPVRGDKTVAKRPDGSRVAFIPSSTPLVGNTGTIVGSVNVLMDVTELEASEQRRREDEPRFRCLFENVGAAVWEQDFSQVADLLDRLRAENVTDLRSHLQAHPELLEEAVARVKIIDVNPFAVQLFEATEKNELLRSLASVFLPETSQIFLEELVTIWEGGRQFGSDTALRTLSGRRIDAIFTITFDGQRCERAYVTILDISKRKASERRLEAVDKIAKAIASNLDLDYIVQTVTDAATELTGAKFGAFFYNLTDPQGERYTLYTLSGAPLAAFGHFQLPRNTAVFDPTFRGLGAVRSADIRADPRYGKSGPHFGMPKGHLPVVSYLAVPVMSRSGEVHGGLFLGHDEANVFTAEAEETVISIAAHAAIAIDNSQLLKAAEREVCERREAERAAQQLAAIVESSEDAILSIDLNGVITSWNAGAERLYGYTAEEAVGRPVTLLVPDDHLGEEFDMLARIRAGDRVAHFETVRRRKNRAVIPVSLTISPIRDNAGVTVGASKIARDISERKQAEQQKDLLIREMAHRVKNLFALASSVVNLSAKSARSADDLATAVGARLESLARAHALTLPRAASAETGEGGVMLQELLGTLLLPYAGETDRGNRVVIRGCDVSVSNSALTGLALVVHEFATNAAKYGALSTNSGRIDIECFDRGETLELVWTERDGPAVVEAGTEGFGTTLGQLTLEKQFRGKIVRIWDPQGLILRLIVPKNRLQQE
ncbi:PAS domain S-box protein [Mycoplana sp. MJR14]|uniref:PAS domain S-box protein n=1 Tax=Mycoplana sp. MJR14 TaxID=3032583 RepID=UPI0023DAF062|nr:PAS domain S-box protein [Mycoplana sp. MJR14]MDF1631539.1 PAS domain S-box protein [Mycoplana sp. MJR14]